MAQENVAPRSRLRQAAVWRIFRLAIEAYNRRDLDAVAIGFQADLEYYPYREFVDAALAEPCYHGPDGYRAYIAAPMTCGAPTSAWSRRSSSTWGTGWCCSRTCRCAHMQAVFRSLRRTRACRR